MALDAVKDVFVNRIEPTNRGAKLADVWSIENVWGILKEKLRGREYKNIEDLKTEIKKEWKKFNVSVCQRMIDKIPARLKMFIDEDSNQLKKH